VLGVEKVKSLGVTGTGTVIVEGHEVRLCNWIFIAGLVAPMRSWRFKVFLYVPLLTAFCCMVGNIHGASGNASTCSSIRRSYEASHVEEGVAFLLDAARNALIPAL
jgi:hypothetical protein